MDAIYQLWGLKPANPNWDGLLEKVNRLQSSYPAKALICGIDAPDDVYQAILERAHQDCSETYLWLPVFSELDDIADFDPLIDWNDRAFLSENAPRAFHFRCPSSSKNTGVFIRDSLNRLKKWPFDGVFLDRIRFPSFQFGLPGVLSCFCPHCREQYYRMGLDVHEIIDACRRLQTRIEAGKPNPMGLLTFDGKRWQLKHKGLQSLLDARCSILFNALSDLCNKFRQNGYKIGFDLFSPALAYFVGQDFGKLLRMADFVKPMMYLNTDAPAGLPYELNMLGAHLAGDSLKTLLSECGSQTAAEFAYGEIQRLEQISSELNPGTPVFYGMEYNKVRSIAKVEERHIHRTIQLFRSAGAKGIVASWSLFSATDENLNALLEELTANKR